MRSIEDEDNIMCQTSEQTKYIQGSKQNLSEEETISLTIFSNNNEKEREEESANIIFYFDQESKQRMNTQGNMISFLDYSTHREYNKEFNDSELLCNTTTQFSYIHPKKQKQKQKRKQSSQSNRPMLYFIIVLLINIGLLFFALDRYIVQIQSQTLDIIHHQSSYFKYIYHSYSELFNNK